MNTQDLIKNLSHDLSREESQNKSFLGGSVNAFLWKWFACAIALALFFIYLLPVREDLAMNIHQPQYLLESLIWFLIATFTARLVFLSSAPGRLEKADLYWIYGLGLVLTTLVLFRSDYKAEIFRADLHQELDWYRGRCGGAILFVGLMGTGLFTAFMRKGAPTKPTHTGLGIALSSGALASFVLQFACVHENSLHIFIWHFLPVAILSVLGGMLGRFLLRW